ncbi:hypothetical protein D3C76_675430 [compost metagenome]
MLTFAVLALNFTALAGIVLGLLLRTPRVRNALELAYIHTSDFAVSRSHHEATRALVWAFTRTALLNNRNTLSLRKILIVSLISSVVFSVAMASVILNTSPDSPDPYLNIGGVFDSFVGVIVFYLIAWPGHFIYDYLICLALLRISKTGSQRSLAKQITYMILAFSAASLIPFAVLVVFFFARFYFPGISPNDINTWDVILMTPFFWNGPTFFWVGVAHLVFKAELFHFMTASNVALFLLSSIASSSIGFFDLLARGLVSSRPAMNFFASTALRLTKTNADHVFNVSMIAFAIGNGLCQIFGISIKP